ncbi:MAG TPA: hypothetical protein VER98_18330, partial [Terriglobia bacterium]|nr:hypothetical protein [Terriglobia bacterium]
KLTSEKKPERVRKFCVFICPINDVWTSGRCFASPGIFSDYFFHSSIERPYSREPQAVAAVYDRPGFFVQSPLLRGGDKTLAG